MFIPWSDCSTCCASSCGLTGLKRLWEGECGACSVMIDGRIVNSCLVPIAQVAANDSTIEGIATDISCIACSRLSLNVAAHSAEFVRGHGSGCGRLLERNHQIRMRLTSNGSRREPLSLYPAI